MSRNVLTNTAIAEQNEPVKSKIHLTDEQKAEFVKAVKIGYYKEFYKKGLITEKQLEILIKMQDKKKAEPAA